MHSALAVLAAIKPTDAGGPRAANRLAFQRDWTFCLLLDLHERNVDYVVICDYHDDVLVVDAATDPNRVDFYQVKTSQADRWSLRQLLARKRTTVGASPSILGKLYAHRFRFKGLVGLTTLITNLPIKVDLSAPPPAESRERFDASDLSPASQQEVIEKLSAELGAPITIDDTLVFEAAQVPVKQHETFVRGRLSEFLNRMDDSDDHPVSALYRAIADEIQRRSNNEGIFATGEEVLQHKGLSRTQVEDVLQRCLAASRRGWRSQLEQHVREGLNRDGVSLMRVRDVCRAVSRYAIERMDRSRVALEVMAGAAKVFIDSDPKMASYTTLFSLLQAGVDSLRGAPEARGYTDEYLMAIIAWEFLDERKLAATTAKHEDEAR